MTRQPFFIPSVILLVLSIPLILGLVPRNWFYGIRTRETLSNESVWRAANRWSGLGIFVSSLFYLMVAWGMPCTTATGTNFLIWILHVFAFVAPLALTFLILREYLRARKDD